MSITISDLAASVRVTGLDSLRKAKELVDQFLEKKSDIKELSTSLSGLVRPAVQSTGYLDLDVGTQKRVAASRIFEWGASDQEGMFQKLVMHRETPEHFKRKGELEEFKTMAPEFWNVIQRVMEGEQVIGVHITALNNIVRALETGDVKSIKKDLESIVKKASDEISMQARVSKYLRGEGFDIEREKIYRFTKSARYMPEELKGGFIPLRRALDTDLIGNVPPENIQWADQVVTIEEKKKLEELLPEITKKIFAKGRSRDVITDIHAKLREGMSPESEASAIAESLKKIIPNDEDISKVREHLAEQFTKAGVADIEVKKGSSLGRAQLEAQKRILESRGLDIEPLVIGTQIGTGSLGETVLINNELLSEQLGETKQIAMNMDSVRASLDRSKADIASELDRNLAPIKSNLETVYNTTDTIYNIPRELNSIKEMIEQLSKRRLRRSD